MFQAISLAPSAMNKQPYLLKFETGTVRLEVKAENPKDWPWMDAGIATAHAITEFGQGQVITDGQGLITKKE